MTYPQALQRLTALCAKSEHCIYDVTEKMKKWEIDAATQQQLISYLLEERYIDEDRYAQHFVRAKKQYNKWGIRKIEQALRFKRIPESVYRPYLEQFCKDGSEEILVPLLQSKLKAVKGKNDYEIKGKLIRFALSRGFEMDQVLQAVGKILN